MNQYFIVYTIPNGIFKRTTVIDIDPRSTARETLDAIKYDISYRDLKGTTILPNEITIKKNTPS